MNITDLLESLSLVIRAIDKIYTDVMDQSWRIRNKRKTNLQISNASETNFQVVMIEQKTKKIHLSQVSYHGWLKEKPGEEAVRQL